MVGVLTLTWDGHSGAPKALLKAESYSLVLMVTLAAASGAVRFVFERRVLEAEAISYREILQRFKVARQRVLDAHRHTSVGDAAASMILQSDQRLGFELGRVALAENEAWLRAHRQRPFEPVV